MVQGDVLRWVAVEVVVRRESTACGVSFGFSEHDESGEDVGKVGRRRGSGAGEDGLVPLVHAE